MQGIDKLRNQVSKQGAKGVMEELQKDIDRQKMNALANAGYERRIALDKVCSRF